MGTRRLVKMPINISGSDGRIKLAEKLNMQYQHIVHFERNCKSEKKRIEIENFVLILNDRKYKKEKHEYNYIHSLL